MEAETLPSVLQMKWLVLMLSLNKRHLMNSLMTQICFPWGRVANCSQPVVRSVGDQSSGLHCNFLLKKRMKINICDSKELEVVVS